MNSTEVTASGSTTTTEKNLTSEPNLGNLNLGACAVKMSSSEPAASGSSSATSSDAAPTAASSSKESNSKKKEPICVLVIGMAGSGKTNVVRRLSTHLAAARKPFHTVNLDPAVRDVPYVPLIDIRDTVNYKEVMKQYGLGPNGGIVTSLNLFSTMFDDVLKIIAKKEDKLDYIIFDTPGQIEVFNWSASGPIIAGALASVYPTIIVYVVDTVRSNNTQTFMANMLYACSILYKYKLPFIIAFNKIDITDCKFALDWMQDFEAFQDVLAEETSFASNLTRSLSLALEEFYCNISACGVSAFTGEGMADLVVKMDKAAIEYEDYRADYEKMKAEKAKKDEKQKELTRAMLQGDLAEDGHSSLASVRNTIKNDTEILIGLDQSDSDSDDERLDEDDTEEMKEGESFKDFLKHQKEKHQNPAMDTS